MSAIVLEVPNQLIGDGQVHAWATASLVGHAPETQVSRWGLPLVTHIFLSDPGKPNLKEDFNHSIPYDDVTLYAAAMAEFAEKMTTYAGSSSNPAEYGRRLAGRFFPTTLPYKIGSAAAFDFTGFNGRPLGDDVMDVMLTLAANKPLGDGVAPDKNRTRSDFPFFGDPYTTAEQQGVTPAVPPRKA